MSIKNKNVLFVFLIVLIPLVITYGDVISGEYNFLSNDKVSAMNVKKAIENSSEYPYWFPWMMGGVPSVHSAQNISDYYYPNYAMKAFKELFGIPWFFNYILHLMFLGVGVYFLCNHLRLGKEASIFGAFIFPLFPHVTAMLVYGHGSQVMTISYIPWIVFSYIALKEDVSLKKLGIFSLLLALQLLRGHVQIAYYTWLMVSIFLIIDFIYQFILYKKIQIKWLTYVLSGLVLGMLGSLSLYFPILSYTPYSTRSKGASSGADYVLGDMNFQQYWATEYSFSFGELITFLIPSYYGFGNGSYWGTMIGTNFPNYMGIIVFLLAIYGVLRYKWNIYKVFVFTSAILFLLLSFGKNFFSFFSFFYEFLPFFSKFRNPMYLLIIFQFCVVILSSMGIKMIFLDIKNRFNYCLWFCLSCIVLLVVIPVIFKHNLISTVSNDKIIDFTYEKEVDFIEFSRLGRELKSDEKLYYRENVEERIDGTNHAAFVQSMIDSDIFVMALIVFLVFSLIIVQYFVYPYNFWFNNKVLLGTIFLVIVFFDLYLVNRKVMYPNNSNYLRSECKDEFYKFYTDGDLERMNLLKRVDSYEPSGVIKEIKYLKDSGELFRVYDPSKMMSNEWSRYGVENILGYHPAKLSSYERMLPVIYSKSNFIFKMLNVGFDLEEGKRFDMNFERAFFIDEVVVDEHDQVLRNQLYYSDRSPQSLSYITEGSIGYKRNSYDQNEEDFVSKFNVISPNEILIEVSTSGPQFLAISEVYYPNGWFATINGIQTDIFEVNDLIRGISIDKAGNHTIKLLFAPYDLKIGAIISLGSFMVMLICIFYTPIRRMVKVYV
ncbi:MAG: hypothetical protein CMG00_06710 [Candidatus Marinimicrobia bacterium]|nr:hypothetical protein [Candidatus Neomarinimicrobiota bacterium]